MMYNDVTHALRDIIDKNGTEIFSNPRRCVAMLSDLAPNKSQDIVLLRQVLENGLADEFISPRTESEKKKALENVYEKLCRNVRLDKSAAEEACNIFAEALEWKVEWRSASTTSPVLSRSKPSEEVCKPVEKTAFTTPKDTYKPASTTVYKPYTSSSITEEVLLTALKIYVGLLGMITLINIVLGIFARERFYSMIMHTSLAVLALSVALVVTGIIVGIIHPSESNPFADVCDGYPGLWIILNLLLLIILFIVHKITVS